MFKLLFNIFIVYALWHLFKMFFAVNKTQKQFHQRMNDLDGEIQRKNTQVPKDKDKNRENGEYIDYEEIK